LENLGEIPVVRGGGSFRLAPLLSTFLATPDPFSNFPDFFGGKCPPRLKCLLILAGTVCNWCEQVEDELDEISNQEFEQFEKSLEKDK